LTLRAQIRSALFWALTLRNMVVFITMFRVNLHVKIDPRRWGR